MPPQVLAQPLRNVCSHPCPSCKTMCTCTGARIHIHAQAHTHTHAQTHTCTHSCSHTVMDAYTHTHTVTHSHTPTHPGSFSSSAELRPDEGDNLPACPPPPGRPPSHSRPPPPRTDQEDRCVRSGQPLRRGTRRASRTAGLGLSQALMAEGSSSQDCPTFEPL